MPDIYDRQDMGALRRRIRKAGETYLRERELYLSLVHQFLEVSGAVGILHSCTNHDSQPWYPQQRYSRALHPFYGGCGAVGEAILSWRMLMSLVPKGKEEG